jgi:peptidoglycan/LPS O-acetylase OafA/YrhL
MSPISKGSREIVYELLYQGVAGAIIFDIADPYRRIQLATVGLAMIGAAIVTDYWHMVVELDVKNAEDAKPVADGFIAVFFGVAYFAFTRVTKDPPKEYMFPTYCRVSLFFLALAYACIAIYDERTLPAWRRALRVATAMVAALGFVGAYFAPLSPDGAKGLELAVVIVTTILYAAFVFLPYRNDIWKSTTASSH